MFLNNCLLHMKNFLVIENARFRLQIIISVCTQFIVSGIPKQNWLATYKRECQLISVPNKLFNVYIWKYNHSTKII